MGNILGRLCKDGFTLCSSEEGAPPAAASVGAHHAAAGGQHAVAVAAAGFAALLRDLHQIEITGKVVVPEGLSKYVRSSTAAQSNWYRKLLVAWKTSQPPPGNAEEASIVICEALRGHRKVDVQGFLSFYGLSPCKSEITDAAPPAFDPQVTIQTRPWPKGVHYELLTLPIDNKGVVDGDTLTVYVDTSRNAREAASIPELVVNAVVKMRAAHSAHDLTTEKAIRKEISQAGYTIIEAKDGNRDILARKYKIRLRGIDAPESKMPHGLESKSMLLSLVEGKPVLLLVYNADIYGRLVADIYCKNVFIQEILLKNGAAWHYSAYDRRPELSEWEHEARNARIGLWAKKNPQKPWEYRKEKKNGG